MNEDWEENLDEALQPLRLGFDLGDDTRTIELALDLIDSLLRGLPEFESLPNDPHRALVEAVGGVEDIAELLSTLEDAMAQSDYDSNGELVEVAAETIDDIITGLAERLEAFAEERRAREEEAAKKRRTRQRDNKKKAKRKDAPR